MEQIDHYFLFALVGFVGLALLLAVSRVISYRRLSDTAVLCTIGEKWKRMMEEEEKEKEKEKEEKGMRR